jgi:hypothetical protein
VLTGRGTSERPAALLYGMAHALWLARPEHVIAAVLDPRDGSDLMQAARISFAPRRGESPDPGVQDLAAALWPSVPTREQKRLSVVLREHALSPPELRTAVRSAAARAALLASGSVTAAFQWLSETEPDLLGVDLHEEAGYLTACQRSQPFADTVRAALSATHLRTLELAG